MSTERALSWTPVLEAPDTTLWLPMGDKRHLEQIAAEGAPKVLGSDAPAAQLKMMERVIHDGTSDAKQRGCIRSGLLFWPDLTRFPPVANIDVLAYHPPDPDEPLTLDHYREVYGTPDSQTIGPIDTTEVELLAGPALRFHRAWARKKRFSTSTLREDITYAIRPPEIEESVVLVVSWVEPQLTPAMIKIADKIAQTLEIEFKDRHED
jgi:hypothetical protein